MLGNLKVVCVIPARLRSTRFAKKMLASLRGKPLLQWVWEAASKVLCFDEVVFAIDAQEIADILVRFSAPLFFTSVDCRTGTERLIELQARGEIKADIWVNWQGDEPFINEEMIQTLLSTCQTEPSDVWTLKKRILNPSDVLNPHIAKLVTDAKGNALYFSRSPIPFYRDHCPEEKRIYFKHVGLYAFSAHALRIIGALAPCSVEEAEQLEQLRFLYHGLKVRVHETAHEVFGIDLPEHLAQAEKLLR